MKYQNEMKLVLPSYSKNEAFARSVVAAFCAQLNPTMEEINDVKTAVSEAVTNSIVHGYAEQQGNVEISASYVNGEINITIRDEGVGIPDVKKALQPFYTTRPEEERSGMGFTVMQAFMDEVQVQSTPNKGTEVRLKKIIRSEGNESTNA